MSNFVAILMVGTIPLSPCAELKEITASDGISLNDFYDAQF
jgi:hypothetical protein